MISLVNPLYDFIQLMVKQIKKANADVIISGKAILFNPHLQKLPLISYQKRAERESPFPLFFVIF